MFPNFASQIRTAFSNVAWNTGSSSPCELDMTRRTSDVAVCCSNDSDSSLASREAELFQFRRGASALRACGVAVWSIRLWNALAWPFTKTQQGIVAGQTG